MIDCVQQVGRASASYHGNGIMYSTIIAMQFLINKCVIATSMF